MRASLIVTESEGRPVPANRGLSEEERSRRLANIHAPYHDAIDACLDAPHEPLDGRRR